MPMYTSPPGTPEHSPARTTSTRRSRRQSRAGSSLPSPSDSYGSRSRSRSRSSSRTPRRRQHARKEHNPHGDYGVSDTEKDSLVKTSLIFLGTIGAATLAAHKFWPKGITYGDKEDWECENKDTKEDKKAQKQLQEEKNRGSGSVSGGSNGSSTKGPRHREGREERRARYRENSGVYEEDEIVIARNRSGGREMSRERYMERGISRDRGVGIGPGVDRRLSRREANYYPSAPQRPPIMMDDRSTAATAGSRRPSVGRGRPVRHYDPEPEPEPEPEPPRERVQVHHTHVHAAHPRVAPGPLANDRYYYE